MNVSNQNCIRRLSMKSMQAAKIRNIIAILAIALTTILFTCLFTVALSVNYSFQQANFRQAGGYAHGSFKYLTEEQFETIKGHSLIRQYGLRRFAGMPSDAPFHKSHVEVSYCDANEARWMFCDPVEGRLPAENTNEAATDTKVLELLGVEPVVGNEFTITFDVNGTAVTESFLLSGWWETDEAIVASHVLLPLSRVEDLYRQAGIGSGIGSDGMTGSWMMDVMLGSSMHIEQDLKTILADYGFQSENPSDGSYISTGVNWGYTGAQLSNSIDPLSVITLAGLLLIILLTGYLIIYNVFQISVANDIRYYGLLKTIGTTGRQLRRMIRQQAFVLSAFGIPIGLLAGYAVGSKLTPFILSRFNGLIPDAVSANPLIFLGSALFSLITVTVSCHRPGKMAANVSPIEALRYTGNTTVKKKMRKAQTGASLPKMALASLGRGREKTTVTIASLSLALLLLNLTFTFTNGFDMDKYLSRMAADFVIADAGYFQVGTLWSSDHPLPEEVIAELETRPGVETGGRVYGKSSPVEEFITEEYFRSTFIAPGNDPEALNTYISNMEKNEEGLLAAQAQLYGMERYALDKLQVLEGDLSRLYEPGSRYIAAVYMADDYGNPQMNTHWAKVGDKVTLRYVDEYDDNSRASVYQDIQYEVAATVIIPASLDYRYHLHGSDEYILNDRTFLQDSGTDRIMYYACDVSDESTADMEQYLSDLTNNRMPQLDYESKASYVSEFDSLRNMFLMTGSLLSFIVGLVGILNFLNAVLTSILTRRVELAMLQSIGMTGRQLKTMLIWEGLYYAAGAVVLSLILSIAGGPLLSNALGNMFWFFTYRFTILPVLLSAPAFILIGIVTPLLVYRAVSRRSIVERLRETEM